VTKIIKKQECRNFPVLWVERRRAAELPFAVICCCAETVRLNKTDNNNSSIRLLCRGRSVNQINPFFSIMRVCLLKPHKSSIFINRQYIFFNIFILKKTTPFSAVKIYKNHL